MANAIPRVGDIGTVFQATIKDETGAVVNVSGASSKVIKFKKSDGSTVSKTASYTTDGTDGKIEYTIQSGDLNMAGDWQAEAIVTVGANTWSSTIHDFRVGVAL